MGEEPVERFRPTGGLLSGVLALVVLAAVVVVGVANLSRGFPLPFVTAALVLGVLAWAAMLRPRVWATADELVLRNMLSTACHPAGRDRGGRGAPGHGGQAGDKRYVSPAVGKPRGRSSGWGRREAAVAPFGSPRGRRPELPTGGHVGDQRREPPYADFVADRINHLATSARERRGIAERSPEQRALAADVRLTRAWPEIIALALACLLFLASLVA